MTLAAKRALAVLLGLLLGLLAAEALTRKAALAPEVGFMERGRFRVSANPRLGYEPVPDVDYAGTSLSFYDYRGRSNRLGYRDTDHDVAKPQGVYRLVVLGDSIAAGLKVERFEDTFPAVLQAELVRFELPAEVLNFGVSGYGTQQEIETLIERGLAYDPDLVLLAYCHNDERVEDGGILETLLEEQRGRLRPGGDRLRRLLLRSALYRYLAFELERRTESHASDVSELVAAATAEPLSTSFARLQGLSQQHGFDVLVAVFPTLWRLHRYAWEDRHRELEELSLRHGFLHLDLLHAFRDCQRQSGKPMGADRVHPNARGHDCAGRAMARLVAEVMSAEP